MTDIDSDSGPPYALVTGALSGIGYELAWQFAANGFDVLIVAEDDGLGAAAAKLDGDGHVKAIQVDLRDPDEVERLWARITAGGRHLAPPRSTPVSVMPDRSWKPPSRMTWR